MRLWDGLNSYGVSTRTFLYRLDTSQQDAPSIVYEMWGPTSFHLIVSHGPQAEGRHVAENAILSCVGPSRIPRFAPNRIADTEAVREGET
jgi:hypothetical protein